MIPTYFVIFRKFHKIHEVGRDLDFFVIFPDFLNAQPTKVSRRPAKRPVVAGFGRPLPLLGRQAIRGRPKVWTLETLCAPL